MNGSRSLRIGPVSSCSFPLGGYACINCGRIIAPRVIPSKYGMFTAWRRKSLLMIRLTRYLGCFIAYGVFLWRYFNVPQNWRYVWTPWSIGIIIATLIPETVYPIVYLWVHKTQKDKRA